MPEMATDHSLADLAPSVPAKATQVRRWQVRLADGFVCFVGTAKWRVNEVAANHPGSKVEPAPAAAAPVT